MAFLWYCPACNKHSTMETEPVAGSRVTCGHCGKFGFMGAEYRKRMDMLGREFGRQPAADDRMIALQFETARMLDEGPGMDLAVKLSRLELLEKEVIGLRRVIAVLADQNGGGLTIDRAALDKTPDDLVLESWIEARTNTCHVRVKQKK